MDAGAPWGSPSARAPAALPAAGPPLPWASPSQPPRMPWQASTSAPPSRNNVTAAGPSQRTAANDRRQARQLELRASWSRTPTERQLFPPSEPQQAMQSPAESPEVCGSTLEGDMRTLLADRSLHDLTIVLDDGSRVTACRAVLAARSDVFRAMLYGGMRESTEGTIRISDVSSASFEALLEFLFTDQIAHFLGQAAAAGGGGAADGGAAGGGGGAAAGAGAGGAAAPAAAAPAAVPAAPAASAAPERRGAGAAGGGGEDGGGDEGGAPIAPLMELLGAAERFNVPGLKMRCERELLERLTFRSACSVLLTAHRQGATSLTRACLKYVATHREQVKQAGGLAVLVDEPELLMELLLVV